MKHRFAPIFARFMAQLGLFFTKIRSCDPKMSLVSFDQNLERGTSAKIEHSEKIQVSLDIARIRTLTLKAYQTYIRGEEYEPS